jgi:tetratricopeptide (TPR) repeat protein
MVTRRQALALLLLALATGGCASLSSSSGRALNAGVPTADELAAPYRTQAIDLEREGQLRRAAEAWTNALALAPGHEPSRQALKRLRERMDREFAEHMKEGWHALGRDASAEAHRHFMAALAIDPDSREAQQALRATPAPPVSAPEPKPTAAVARPASLTTSSARSDAAPKARVESTAPRAAATPGPRPGEEKKPDVLYAAAQAHLADHNDEEAYRTLTQLASVSPGYKDSAALLRNIRTRLVQQRYQEGLRLLREERLEGAIEQWRGVLELDPKHANARRNIEQAERMLRTLAAQPKP